MSVEWAPGKSARIPLVLVHGWGMNAGVWAGLPDALTERFAPVVQRHEEVA